MWLMILFPKIAMPIECFWNILGKLREEAPAANTKYQKKKKKSQTPPLNYLNNRVNKKKNPLPSLKLQRTNKTGSPDRNPCVSLEAERSKFKSTLIGLL